MAFEFCCAQRIVYGRGEFARVGQLVAPLGRRAMVLHAGAPLEPPGILATLQRLLSDASIEGIYHAVHAEPDVASVDAAAACARDARCELVIGLGGGSVIDTAKAVSGLLTHPGSVRDYLEVVGTGNPITRPAAPLLAVPTTAGTGSEVTRNAVVADRASRFKASMRSPHLIPRVALVDPSLTDSVPPQVTAATGLDALTQLVEPYVSTRAQPMTDALALEGIRLVARSLVRAVEQGTDSLARDDMSLAALLGGLCLANAGLGAVHGFAAPLGGLLPIPHGAACAVLLPHVIAANVAALRADDSGHATLRRYDDVARALLGQSATVDEAIEWLRDLVRTLRVPSLRHWGMREEDVSYVVELAKRASSMRSNPVVLSDSELVDCLRRAW